MGGRPRPREKPQRARWRVASPSPAPKPRPQATGGDGPPRGGDGAGASPTGSPRPHAALPRGPRRPAAPPRPLRPAPTHALLTARSFITYTPLRRTSGTPAPGVPGAPPPALAPVREPHPSGSKVFPSSQALSSPLCSSPSTNPCCKPPPRHAAGCISGRQQPAAAQQREGGPVPQKRAAPSRRHHPTPPCHRGAGCQAETPRVRGRVRMRPRALQERRDAAGRRGRLRHPGARQGAPSPSPPAPAEAAFPRAVGWGAAVAASQASLAARRPPHPHGQGSVTPRAQVPGPSPGRDHRGGKSHPAPVEVPAAETGDGAAPAAGSSPSSCRDGWGGRRGLAVKEKEAGAGKSGLFPAAVSLLTLDNPVPQFTLAQQPACSGGGRRTASPGQRGAKSPPNPHSTAGGSAGKGTESLLHFSLPSRATLAGKEGQTLPAPLGAPACCFPPLPQAGRRKKGEAETLARPGDHAARLLPPPPLRKVAFLPRGICKQRKNQNLPQKKPP